VRGSVPGGGFSPDGHWLSYGINRSNRNNELRIMNLAAGTVFWHQSIEMYDIARRARKNAVFLVYNGEDHSLRQRKNKVDYQHRILAWFAHYLKGESAESWIDNGQSFLDRDAEVKRLTAKEPVPQP
jgi:hypothetical protein